MDNCACFSTQPLPAHGRIERLWAGRGEPQSPTLALPARPCWTLFPKTELYVYNIHGLAKNRCVISRHERVERPSCTCTTDVKSAAHR